MNKKNNEVVIRFLREKGLGSHFLPNKFCVDSRRLEPGDIFVALRGQFHDGHAFLKDLPSKGCHVALVSDTYRGPDYGLFLIRSEDPLTCLQKLAKESVSFNPSKTISVTGSVGKTTTKEFIAHLLSARFNVGKTSGNANSQIGMPLSLLNEIGGEDIKVVEMGMSDFGHISRLVDICPPDIAVITKIGLAHAENFPKGLDDIAKAKAEILASNKLEFCLAPTDFKKYQAYGLLKNLPFCFIGQEGDYSFCKEGDSVSFFYKGILECKIKDLKLPNHFIENALYAIAVARFFNVDWAEIAHQMQSLPLLKNRFESITIDGIQYVSDCYNASPESCIAALENLPSIHKNSKIIFVFGEMKGLGLYTDLAHVKIAEHALSCVDSLFCLGESIRDLPSIFHQKNKEGQWFENIQALKQKLRQVMRKGDLVLIKGSNANQLWRIFDPL
ncbi:MAG: UDP-N-acetylmuramoyl-tripeptide--D-alanyl-D-alanine ligase [Rhabdochlamydiaceae bacterium]